MKKRLSTMLLMLFAAWAQAQQVVLLNENFDSGTTTMVSSGTPGWTIVSNLWKSAGNSMNGQYGTGTTSYLTTPMLDFTGNPFVFLDFNHIGKISFFDKGIIEVSTDNVNWTQVTSSNATYVADPPNTSTNWTTNNNFTAASYPTLWSPGSDVQFPNNATWWKHERFDLAQLCGNQPSIWIRFAVGDLDATGMNGANGWNLDDISVVAANCELVPPTITLPSPGVAGCFPDATFYGNGTVYNNLGPFHFLVSLSDISGIAAGELFYAVNVNSGGTYQPAGMFFCTSDDDWEAEVPAVNQGDTICWYVTAMDASSCTNVATSQTYCFVVAGAITFPYCDDFDSGNPPFISNTTAGTSNWQLGTPGFGLTNTTNSGLNAWDIDLIGGYQNNSTCDLTSPTFDFQLAGVNNPILKFWLNYNTDIGDGTRVEYSLANGPWTVIGSGSSVPPNAINWYDGNNPDGDAWSGVSNGWKESTFKLASISGVAWGSQSNVRFRFRFKSNGFGTNLDGFSMDDFCVTIPPPNDVGVDVIVQPVGAQSVNTNVAMVATITNFGSSTQSNICVTAVLNDTTFFTTTLAGPLLGGASAQVNFSPDSIPVIAGNQTLCFYTCMPTDTSHANDTICTTIFGVQSIPLTNGFCDDFEGATALWYNQFDANADTSSAWQQGTPSAGQTNTAHSGVNAWDINLTGPYNNGAFTYLMSPYFDFSTTAGTTLSFWQNRNTLTFAAGMWLEYSGDGGTTWDTLGVENDPCGVNWYNTTWFNGERLWHGSSNGWEQSTYLLTCAGPALNNNPNKVQFRFGFASDQFSGGSDGVSIDDFCIILPPPIDVGISAIVAPIGAHAVGDTLPVIVQLENFGVNTQTSVDVWVTITSFGLGTVTYGPFNWNGSIITSQTVNDTIPLIPPFIIPAGLTTICSYTSFPGDTVPTNDTSCVNVIGVPTLTLSYCDNFDDGNPLWTTALAVNPVTSTLGDAGTVWELGTPNFGTTNSAKSLPYSWDINLNSVYTGDAYTDLTSPFFDFTGLDSVKLSFWQNWNAENGWDGSRLDYSIDGGVSWIVLGSGMFGAMDPNATNWYNAPAFNAPPGSLNSTDLPGWTATSNGWVKCTYNLAAIPALNNPAGLIQFRFNFSSDAIIENSGASIDNFSLKINCPDDASISAIAQPNSNLPAGNTSNVVVSLSNEGDAPLSNVVITYVVQPGGSPVNFTYTGAAIAPGASTLVTLPGIIIPSGAYCLSVYTNLATDCEHCNDTTTVCLVGVPTLPVTYCDDFETGNVGWAATINTGFDPGTIWQYGTPNFGVTTGAHSPTNAWDVNLSSAYGNNASTTLTSPFFDMDSSVNCALSFWQNYNTDNNNDGVFLEYSLDHGISWSILGTGPVDANSLNWYTSGNLNFTNLPGWSGNSNGWKKSTYYLGAVPGFTNATDLVQFRFTFTSNFGINTTADGYSIDDFCIVQPPPNDIGVSAITDPTGSVPGGASISPSVILHNYGTVNQTSASIVYVVGATTFTYNWTGTITPGQSIPITFPTGSSFVAPTGPFTICAYTSWALDQDNSNDTICIDLVGVPTITVNYTTPYCDNFDTTFTVWSAQIGPNGNPGSVWEWGVPNFGGITSAHSTPNAWDINLTSAYTDDAEAYLYSPYFNFSNAADPIVSFWQNYDTETNFDGTAFQYQIGNNGWNIMGTLPPDTNGVNWYTNNIISTQEPAWAGSTNGAWVRSEYRMGVIPGMNNTNSTVQFRFRFNSDASVSAGFDGEAIDDFCIEVPIPVDVAPVTLSNYPANQLVFPGQNVSFASYIKNKGTADLTQVTAVLYDEQGNVISSDLYTISPPVQKKDSALHVFTSPWVAIPGFHCFSVVTSQPNGTQDLNTANDTFNFCFTVFDSVNAYPYCNDMEQAPQWVALSSTNYSQNQSWELGLPSQPFLNSPHSGINAWTLNTSQNYENADASALFSPRFTVSANKCYKLTFFHQFKTERYEDGGAVEYSLNDGVTWNNIDFTGTPNASLFNYAYTTSLGWANGTLTKGWTGNSFATSVSGWLNGEKILRPNVNGHMIIRWKFAADFDSTQEGWTIDDVCLNDIGFCSPIGIEELEGKGFELAQNYPNPFNSLTTFDFLLPEDGAAMLYITDVMGKIVAIPVQDKLQAGKYSLNYDATSLAAGIYYYTLEYNSQKITRKMVITH